MLLGPGVLNSYKDGKISSETFLRRIDTFNLLETYETKKKGLLSYAKTLWRQLISRNLDEDASLAFPDIISIDLATDTKWTKITREEQMLSARGGHTSLHQRYGVDTPVKQTEEADALTESRMTEPDSDVEEASRLIRGWIDYSMTGEYGKEDEP